MKQYRIFVKNKSRNKKYVDLFLFHILRFIKEQNIFVLAFVPVFVPLESPINKGYYRHTEQKNKNTLNKVVLVN